jgi:hypothetical protein
MRFTHGCPPGLVLVDLPIRFICSATKQFCTAPNWRSNMVENRVELFAVGTGVVLTAIAALVPFFS